MPKITIKDLATELNIDAAVIKAHLNENGFEAKTSSKQLDDDMADMVRKNLGSGKKAEKPAVKETPAKEETVKEAPVKAEPAKEEPAAKDSDKAVSQGRNSQGRNSQGRGQAQESRQFPVRFIGVDGRPNPGRFLGPDNRPVQGRFVGPDGNPMPVRFIGADGRPVPVQTPDGKTITPRFVGQNGNPIPVKFIGTDGRPAQGKFIGPDGKVLSVRFIGNDGRPVPVRLMTAAEQQNRQQQIKQQGQSQPRNNEQRKPANPAQGQSQRPEARQERPERKAEEKPAKTNTQPVKPAETETETKVVDSASVRDAFAKALGTSEKKKAPAPQPAAPVVSTLDDIKIPEIRISGNVYENMKAQEAAKEAAKAEKEQAQAQAQSQTPAQNTRNAGQNDRGQRTDRRDGQGFNRDGRFQGSRDGQGRDGQGFNRDGRFQGNRDGQGRDGQGFNRDGRFQGNRDGQGRDGQGFNRDGRFQGSRDGQGRDGQGFNRDGRFQGNRDGQRPQGQGAQGGFRNGGAGKPGFDKGAGFNKDAEPAPRFGNDRRNSKPGASKGGMAVDISGDISRNKRADNIKNKGRDKDDKNRRFDYDPDAPVKNKKDPNRKGAFQKPVAVAKVEEDPNEIRTVMIPEMITLKELADKLKKSPSEIIKKLFLEQKKMTTLNAEFTFEEAEEIALGYNCIAEKEVPVDIVEELMRDIEDPEDTLIKRPPVVCVMGHVDHGKTSLLDAIRSTNVTAREAGGITQHIGAYVVEINGEKITFLDTPGHEAFTSMRMRGAKSTDIAILVVAADDGVMPQTVEAINHAKAAQIPIIVAVNKIDKPGANIEKVKQELTEQELVAEDWGGDTVFVPVSAKTGEGIEQLLEMVLLTAEVGELKANPNRMARGIVIEAELDKGRGPVATVLVQKGTLKVGEMITIGATHGKVRAMINDLGKQVKEATPSTPVEILGLDGVPGAGDVFMVVKDEKEARAISDAFIAQSKEKLIADTKAKLSLDGLFSQIKAGDIKDLNIIVKADVQGSVEAVKQSLLKLSNEEVMVRIIHGAVGAINESDVNLASASNAIIIGFNVKPDNSAKDIAEREKVDIKLYRVIYQAIQDVEAAMKGMLKPIYKEKVIGHAEIRMLFKASTLGTIAGSYVLDGKIVRGCSVRVKRGDDVIWEGPLASLKRFKDDVKEVAEKYECGLVFEKFNDFQELDTVEAYIMEEVPR